MSEHMEAMQERQTKGGGERRGGGGGGDDNQQGIDNKGPRGGGSEDRGVHRWLSKATGKHTTKLPRGHGEWIMSYVLLYAINILFF